MLRGNEELWERRQSVWKQKCLKNAREREWNSEGSVRIEGFNL